MSLKHYVLITFTVWFIWGCSNSRVVQPLNNNQWQVAASVGSPVLEKNGQPETAGLSSVNLAYGLTQNISAYAGVNTGSYLQRGVFHMDVGYAQELIHPFHNRPGISYSLALNTFRNAESQIALYPQLDINAYWLGFRGRDFYYLGVANWLELENRKAHGEKQEKRWFPSVHTGYYLAYGAYGLTLELKYLAITSDNENPLVDYLSPSNKGVIGVYLSASRKF